MNALKAQLGLWAKMQWTVRQRILTMAVCTLAFAPVRDAMAQATSTASKSAAIDVYGGFAYATPDFGPDGDNNTGGTLGLAYTRYFHLPVHVAVEARGNDVTGQVLNERSVLGGVKVGKDYRRFTPYLDVMFGVGTLHYNVQPIPGYTSDRGRVLAYGGGVDFPVYKTFSVKADFQLQAWNLGVNAVTRPQGGDFTLSPTVALIGVTYRIPFHSEIR